MPFYSTNAVQNDGRPIKDKAHELQVEGWRKAVQSDSSGGVLFTLTALTEVAVLPVQLLLLQGKNNTHKTQQVKTFSKWCIFRVSAKTAALLLTLVYNIRAGSKSFLDSDTLLLFPKRFFFHSILLRCLSCTLDFFTSMSCPPLPVHNLSPGVTHTNKQLMEKLGASVLMQHISESSSHKHEIA